MNRYRGGCVSQLQTFLGLGTIAVIVDLTIRLVALVVVPRNRLPTAAMAWLLAIFSFLWSASCSTC